VDYKEYYDKIFEDFKECSEFLAAIGNETRQLIILEVIKAGPSGIRPGEIAENVSLSRPAVSHHLKILKDANVLHLREEGTMNYYYICIRDIMPTLAKANEDLQALIKAMYNEEV